MDLISERKIDTAVKKKSFNSQAKLFIIMLTQIFLEKYY